MSQHKSLLVLEFSDLSYANQTKSTEGPYKPTNKYQVNTIP